MSQFRSTVSFSFEADTIQAPTYICLNFLLKSRCIFISFIRLLYIPTAVPSPPSIPSLFTCDVFSISPSQQDSCVSLGVFLVTEHFWFSGL